MIIVPAFVMDPTDGWRTEVCRCGHIGDDHDAGECWARVPDPDVPYDRQCPCPWLEFVESDFREEWRPGRHAG